MRYFRRQVGETDCAWSAELLLTTTLALSSFSPIRDRIHPDEEGTELETLSCLLRERIKAEASVSLRKGENVQVYKSIYGEDVKDCVQVVLDAVAASGSSELEEIYNCQKMLIGVLNERYFSLKWHLFRVAPAGSCLVRLAPNRVGVFAVAIRRGKAAVIALKPRSWSKVKQEIDLFYSLAINGPIFLQQELDAEAIPPRCDRTSLPSDETPRLILPVPPRLAPFLQPRPATFPRRSLPPLTGKGRLREPEEVTAEGKDHMRLVKAAFRDDPATLQALLEREGIILGLQTPGGTKWSIEKWDDESVASKRLRRHELAVCLLSVDKGWAHGATLDGSCGHFSHTIGDWLKWRAVLQAFVTEAHCRPAVSYDSLFTLAELLRDAEASSLKSSIAEATTSLKDVASTSSTPLKIVASTSSDMGVRVAGVSVEKETVTNVDRLVATLQKGICGLKVLTDCCVSKDVERHMRLREVPLALVGLRMKGSKEEEWFVASDAEVASDENREVCVLLVDCRHERPAVVSILRDSASGPRTSKEWLANSAALRAAVRKGWALAKPDPPAVQATAQPWESLNVEEVFDEQLSEKIERQMFPLLKLPKKNNKTNSRPESARRELAQRCWGSTLVRAQRVLKAEQLASASPPEILVNFFERSQVDSDRLTSLDRVLIGRRDGKDIEWAVYQPLDQRDNRMQLWQRRAPGQEIPPEKFGIYLMSVTPSTGLVKVLHVRPTHHSSAMPLSEWLTEKSFLQYYVSSAWKFFNSKLDKSSIQTPHFVPDETSFTLLTNKVSDEFNSLDDNWRLRRILENAAMENGGRMKSLKVMGEISIRVSPDEAPTMADAFRGGDYTYVLGEALKRVKREGLFRRSDRLVLGVVDPACKNGVKILVYKKREASPPADPTISVVALGYCDGILQVIPLCEAHKLLVEKASRIRTRTATISDFFLTAPLQMKIASKSNEKKSNIKFSKDGIIHDLPNRLAAIFLKKKSNRFFPPYNISPVSLVGA